MSRADRGQIAGSRHIYVGRHFLEASRIDELAAVWSHDPANLRALKEGAKSLRDCEENGLAADERVLEAAKEAMNRALTAIVGVAGNYRNPAYYDDFEVQWRTGVALAHMHREAQALDFLEHARELITTGDERYGRVLNKIMHVLLTLDKQNPDGGHLERARTFCEECMKLKFQLPQTKTMMQRIEERERQRSTGEPHTFPRFLQS